MKVAVNWSVFSLQRYMYQYLGSEVIFMKTLALSVIAALGLATAPAMAQEEGGAAGGSASGFSVGAMSTQAMVFAGVAAAATVAVVSDSSSNPIVDDNPEEPTDPDPIVTVTGTGTNTYTITIPAQ
jgi:hypothetical protein